jgi:BirA family biotin operon repressor/biotin-[acetyl-CoA-carboxylase] ligase
MQPWEQTPVEKARAAILEELRGSEGPVSGQALSQQLGIGRNAVWKHVEALRAMGYRIEGKTRRGYRLLSIPEAPLPFEITHGLATHRLGRSVIFLPVAGSTNDVIRDLAKQGAPEGFLAVADSQLAGRGRRGHMWESPAGGGLWVSVLLRPALAPAQAPLLALLAAVAVAVAIRKQTGLEALVKWPNDVLISGRKVCGVLVEMAAESESIHYIVIGMGINVNLTREQLPEALRSSATSLREECRGRVSRVALLRTILREMELRYDALVTSGPESLVEENRSLSAVLGKEICVVSVSGVQRGLAIGIENDGALRVRLACGDEKLFYAGEVSVRSRMP